MRMEYMQLLTKPSVAQQADLNQLLVDQQNPSSPQFHKWLTPEEFANRFGLSSSDHSKIAAWLQSEGFTIDKLARGRNWVAFTGTADQVSKSFHTSIHRYQVDGATHFANSTEPSVPEALAGVTAGFIGLNDFKLKPMARLVPDYNSGTSHFLAPADFATIYNLNPLYQNVGLDGTGVTIAVVGESDVLLTDLAAFKTRYGLPANVPKMTLYGGSDPGYNGAQSEGTLDLEWSSAIAPKAAINYVYGANAFTAMVSAIDANYAPIISLSYGICEVDYALSAYESIVQQGNAQGITILAASGDAGPAGCDSQSSEPFAQRGLAVDFPASLPEVTGVGGTMFVEGTGTYWATSNSSTFGSALSYIPEVAWNQSGTSGLGAGGGGASFFFPRPAWQTGPGVPMDNARHVPDIALSAAGHDAYEIYYQGSTVSDAGTSCSVQATAGIVALLNQFQVSKGYQAKPGLGNINPQLYRLAQAAPIVFHDTVAGDNMVNCGQGSPDCLTGSFGFQAVPGYDMATGLGSIDASNLIVQWNTVTKGVTVTLTSSTAKTTSNDTVQLTATVGSADGKGTPTGTVAFSFTSGAQASAALVNGAATATFPAYLLGVGTFLAYAEYSGDAAFSSGGASTRVQITAPTGVASIIPSGPVTVWPNLPDAEGVSWQTTLTLREVAGVAAILTGFTIDGQSQPLAQYFPSVNIVPSGSISSTFVLRNQAVPLTHTYGFTGVDAGGQNWSNQLAVFYSPVVPLEDTIRITATPPIVAQDTAADPSCQWPVHIHLDDVGGYLDVVSSLYNGQANISSQIDSIFGTTRIDAWGSISGTICVGGITPPATQTFEYVLSDGYSQQMTVTFVGPPANPAKITASPSTISLAGSGPATLAVGLTDKTQPWTASVYPANRTTSWLSVSQLSGTGPAQLSLTANGTGFEPGVYRATIVLQCINALPQSVSVPVMFVLGGSTSGTFITGVGSSANYQNVAAAGMILSVFGANLANTTATTPGISPLPFSTAGVSAFINGLAAPLLYVSPSQLNLQVPYEAGAGPAVIGINNNGQVAGFQFNITPSAPGIFSDGAGNLIPKSTATAGGNATLYVTGAGDAPSSVKTAYWPSSATSAANLPKPILPLSVTVGGSPAFLLFYGLPSGLLGTTQVNFIVPYLDPGVYPVVVTVGGASSPPVNLTVQ
jgi:uncharacterized protein (TIGR03437 family)